ncbi:glycosyltransferase [Butyrivibrio proteoclasticus]|uniref:glycosyltransferase n=1 Tax=Butyrivibrio proteoclasticus TaxID=43305 RepID=UPI000943A860|nr:glycosyltransferase [Butyrivibrio proteoclasticus]
MGSFISVIITTHNNVDTTIEECIESLWNGIINEIEVIAVDVNSTDGIKAVLSEMQLRMTR